MVEFAGEGLHTRATTTTSLLRFSEVGLDHINDGSTKFENLSFMLPPSSCVVLTGALGCGKSAALRMIVGMEAPTRGRVSFEGQVVGELEAGALDEARRRIGYVPEKGALMNNLTLRENMVLPFRYHNAPTEEEVDARAAATLEMLGLPPLPRVSPPNAGPGLCRQVALARALVLRPSVLVLDSPVAGMDHSAAQGLWRTLNRLMLELPVSIVVACEFPPQQTNLQHRLIDIGKHRPRSKI